MMQLKCQIRTWTGNDLDLVADNLLYFYLPTTKAAVIKAILKQHPTWERRGNSVYNGVGERVKLEWETINE